MKLSKLDALLKETLNMSEFNSIDSSLNGIQVSRENQEIKKVAFAVDASMETFRRAQSEGADLIFVHHGLLWGRQQRLSGIFYERIRYLIQHDIALYAVHLPLDAHPELGNNAGLAELLSLENLRPFGMYKGTKIGFKGTLPEHRTIGDIIKIICGNNSKPLSVLPFGPEEIKKIGIVSGGDPRATLQAMDEKLDLFITGDASHEIYHPALEGGINVIFAGHYLTETWGIKRVAQKLQETTDLEIVLLDIPTGL